MHRKELFEICTTSVDRLKAGPRSGLQEKEIIEKAIE